MRSASKMLRHVTVASVLLAGALHGAAVAAPLQGIIQQDLGKVAGSEPAQATVWLKRPNQAAFEAALAAIYDPTSPRFHQWMTSGQLAEFAPRPEDIATVKAQLLQGGFQIVRVAEDGSSIDVVGDTATAERTFNTAIHRFRRNDTTFTAPDRTPALSGSAATLVASVAGLGSSQMHPLLVRQGDVIGKPVALPLATGSGVSLNTSGTGGGSPLSPYLTTNCFGGTTTGLFSAPGYDDGVTLDGLTMVDGLYSSSGGVCAYDSNQLRAHYGLGEAVKLGLDGRGQTIVIVVAYGSPTLLNDVNTYSKVMGLPQLNNSNFVVSTPLGQTSVLDSGWGEETTLDVTMAHAMAPGAKIVLMISPSDENTDLAATLAYGVTHRLGTVFSLSWGSTESGASTSDVQPFNDIAAVAAAQGIGINVASGDTGDNAVGSPVGASGFPADSPFVTSVGGTTFSMPTAVGTRDIGWGWQSVVPNGNRVILNKYQPELNQTLGAGGGESIFFKKPAWQRGLPGSGRQQPDVSALADPLTGVALVYTGNTNGVQTQFVTSIGGTSAAAPIFSGMMALANQLAGRPLGQAAPLVARMPSWAITDILPLSSHEHVIEASTDGKKISDPQFSPAAIALLPPENTGLIQAYVLRSIRDQTIFTWGYDTSLTVTAGWDNVTGYGQPNGLSFLTAAALEGLGLPLTAALPRNSADLLESSAAQ
jgi:subtilase family serine protease